MLLGVTVKCQKPSLMAICAMVMSCGLIFRTWNSNSPGRTRVRSNLTRSIGAAGSYTNVTPKQLKDMLVNKNFPFINVHVPYEGEIENTDANIPYDQIEENLSRLPTDKNAMLFLYCRSGNMSATAAQTLVRLGYTNVWNLDGGFRTWEQQGFPLLKK